MANPVFVKTVDNYITATMKVLLNAAPGNTYLNQFRSFVTENGGSTKGLTAFASALANYADTDNAKLAAAVVANLGITGTAATTATTNVKALFDAKGAARGEAVLQLVDVMVNLQGDATWGTAANNFVNAVNAGYVYSANSANTSTDLTVLQAVVTTTSTGTVVVPGQTFTLTPGNDFADTSGAYRNSSTTPFDFKFTSANETVNASTATFAGTDVLIDGSKADADVLNVTVSGATNLQTVTNIETINVTAGSDFSAGVITLTNVTGLKTLNVSGATGGAITVTNPHNTGVTTIDGSGLTSAVNGLTVTMAASTSTDAVTIKGGAAGDTLTGAGGADTISGGAGNDTIAGGAGANTLNGDAGNDTITGGANVDTIDGGAGDDTINAGLGNDVIVGGAGADTIATQGGADTVTGGLGIDAITLTTGVNNSETIVFEAVAADNGADTIANFAAGTVAAGGDVLKVSTLIGGTPVFSGAKVAHNAAYTTAAGENVVVISNGATFGASALTTAELQASTIRIGANAKTIMIYEEDDGNAGTSTDAATIYYVTTDANGAYASATLVGSLTGAGASVLTYTSAQFA